MTAPEDFAEGFSSCSNGEGELLARLLDQGQVVDTVPLDWVAWEQKGWAIEGTSPFGQTLFRLKYDSSDSSFQTSGALAKLPQMATNEDGYLMVDGQWVGLRPQEIPCFLQSKLPKAWLERVVEWKRSAHELVFITQEKNRAMYVRVEVDEQNSLNFCSRIIWNYYWGIVTREVQVCGSNYITSIRGLEDYRLEFEQRNGL